MKITREQADKWQTRMSGNSTGEEVLRELIARHAAPAMAEKDAEIEDLITELERAAGKHLRNLSEIATLKAEVERKERALQQIIREGDYTAPEGMKRMAKEGLTANEPS